MAESTGDLDILAIAAGNACDKFELIINAKEPKVMVSSKDPHSMDIVINNNRSKRVDN